MTDHRDLRSAFARPVALVLAFLTTAGPVDAAGPSPRFEQDVLPVLSARCFKCHSAPKPKAHLDLRTRAGMLRGGESGPVLVPGSADRSLLFDMIRKGEMPPRQGGRLTA